MPKFKVEFVRTTRAGINAVIEADTPLQAWQRFWDGEYEEETAHEDADESYPTITDETGAVVEEPEGTT